MTLKRTIAAAVFGIMLSTSPGLAQMQRHTMTPHEKELFKMLEAQINNNRLETSISSNLGDQAAALKAIRELLEQQIAILKAKCRQGDTGTAGTPACP